MIVLLLFVLITIFSSSAQSYTIPQAPLDKLYNRFYTNLATPKPCVTLNTNTGSIGCATSGEEESALYLALSESDVAAASTFNPEDGFTITVVADVSLYVLSARILSVLNNSRRVRGVVLPKPKQRPSTPYSPGPFSSFNPAGTNQNLKPYTFSVFQLDEDSEEYALLRKRATYNKDNEYGFPQYRIQQQYNMQSRGMTTKECIAKRTCAPIGGYSVWSTTQPTKNYNAANAPSSVAVMTGISSVTFFHDEVPSVMGTSASIIATLAVAEALSRDAQFRDTALAKPVFFMFFTGEVFDAMGSMRYVQEVTNFKCQTNETAAGWACLDPYYRMTNFTRLNTSMFESLVYVDQVGARKGQIYTHYDASRPSASVLAAFKAAGANTSSKVGIPPSSLQSFFNAKYTHPNLGGVVLSDYDTEYSDTYYQSGFDTGPLDVDSIIEKANAALQAIGTLALKDTNAKVQTTVNASFVQELVPCLTTSSGCTLFARYGIPSYPTNFYPSVFWFTALNPIPAFIQNFLADVFSYQRSNTSCTGVESDFQNPCEESKSFCVRGKCTVADSYLHQAYSPAITYSKSALNFEVSAENMDKPAWAESNWDDKIGARTYMYDSSKHEGSVLASGILSTCFIAVYFLFIHEKFVMRWIEQWGSA